MQDLYLKDIGVSIPLYSSINSKSELNKATSNKNCSLVFLLGGLIGIQTLHIDLLPLLSRLFNITVSVCPHL